MVEPGASLYTPQHLCLSAVWSSLVPPYIRGRISVSLPYGRAWCLLIYAAASLSLCRMVEPGASLYTRPHLCLSAVWSSLVPPYIRVGSLNNVPSQERTIVVPEVPTARRWDVRQFWAVFIDFGRFQRRYAPKIHPNSMFQARYGTLFKECTRTRHHFYLFAMWWMTWRAVPGPKP